MNLNKALQDIEVFKQRAPKKYNDTVQISGPLYLFNQKLSSFTGKKIDEKYRTSHTELDVLWALYTTEDEKHIMTPSKIKEQLFFSQGAITNILKKLENREYIVRLDDKYDKRVKHVKLTELGKKLCEDAMGEILIHEEKIFSCLDNLEKQQLISILHKLSKQDF